MKTAVIIPDKGRFLVCRRMEGCIPTVEVDCLLLTAACAVAKRLQAQWDREVQAPVSNDPWEPKQIPLGFYTDGDAR